MRFLVRRPIGADIDTLAATVAEAFQDVAASRWLVPDSRVRPRFLSGYFRMLMEHALEHGDVHSSPDLASVAVWLDATRTRPPSPADYDRRLADVCGPWLVRFRVFDRALDDHRPRRPHHYLALLATHPGEQGKGHAAALMAYHHRHLDRYAIPSYVEGMSARSRDLCLRLGYRQYAPPFRLPDSATLWPLWRRPSPPAQ